MFRTLLPSLLVLMLSACSSLFGDTFRDRADDYLSHRPGTAMTLSNDQAGLPIRDALVIPGVVDSPLDGEFVVPRPTPLPALELAVDTTSLVEFQSEDLNPRLERDGAGTLVLRLNGRFAVVWNSVSEALGKASFVLRDLNRSTGTYYIALSRQAEAEDEPGFWTSLFSEPVASQADYLLKMHRSRQGVYMSLQNDLETLADEAVTDAVLAELKTLLDE